MHARRRRLDRVSSPRPPSARRVPKLNKGSPLPRQTSVCYSWRKTSDLSTSLELDQDEDSCLEDDYNDDDVDDNDKNDDDINNILIPNHYLNHNHKDYQERQIPTSSRPILCSHLRPHCIARFISTQRNPQSPQSHRNSHASV